FDEPSSAVLYSLIPRATSVRLRCHFSLCVPPDERKRSCFSDSGVLERSDVSE
ncbi:hypothetical protein LINPERHAP2_LOCUS15759, partial [Linum perenne]